MISVIIPAYNEQEYLNQTIVNFLSTAKGEVEVIVVLNGYDQKVYKQAKKLKYKDNLGERVAMNTAAYIASGEYFLRIDGHCDVDEGWDIKMLEVFKDKPKAIAVAAMTAVDKNWNRIKGHYYGFCNLLPTMEEKHDHDKNNAKSHESIEPNMAFTGCGFMIAKDFYWEVGGADESLPSMGAIGPEFAVKAHLFGDGVFTRTDVIIGHIFDANPGYDTSDVIRAREMLVEKYGGQYETITKKFGDVEIKKGSSVDHIKNKVTTVRRQEVDIEKDDKGKIVQKIVRHYVYIYKDDGLGLTEQQIRKIYSPLAKYVGKDVYYPDQNGKLVKVDIGKKCQCGIIDGVTYSSMCPIHNAGVKGVA